MKYEIFYFPRSFDWVCIFKRICEFSSALYLFTFLKMSLVVKYLPVNRTKMKIQPSLKMNVWNRFFKCIWRIWTYGGSNSRKYLSFWKILGTWTLHNGCVTALQYSNVTMKKLFKFRKEISLTICFVFFSSWYEMRFFLLTLYQYRTILKNLCPQDNHLFIPICISQICGDHFPLTQFEVQFLDYYWLWIIAS